MDSLVAAPVQSAVGESMNNFVDDVVRGEFPADAEQTKGTRRSFRRGHMRHILSQDIKAMVM